MSYGLPLKGDGDEKCLSILNSVEETLSRQLRACKVPVSKRKFSEGIFLKGRVSACNSPIGAFLFEIQV